MKAIGREIREFFVDNSITFLSGCDGRPRYDLQNEVEYELDEFPIRWKDCTATSRFSQWKEEREEQRNRLSKYEREHIDQVETQLLDIPDTGEFTLWFKRTYKKTFGVAPYYVDSLPELTSKSNRFFSGIEMLWRVDADEALRVLISCENRVGTVTYIEPSHRSSVFEFYLNLENLHSWTYLWGISLGLRMKDRLHAGKLLVYDFGSLIKVI